MTTSVFGFCAVIVLSLAPYRMQAQMSEQASELSFRPQGAGYAVVGLGVVQGLRIGGKLNSTNRTSIEFSIGTVPFLGLSGFKATIYGAGYNYYIRENQFVTGFFSLLAGYAAITTTSNEYKSNLLLFSPTIGVDYASERQLNLFLRVGFGGAFASGAKTKTAFTMDIGAGWRMW